MSTYRGNCGRLHAIGVSGKQPSPVAAYMSLSGKGGAVARSSAEFYRQRNSSSQDCRSRGRIYRRPLHAARARGRIDVRVARYKARGVGPISGEPYAERRGGPFRPACGNLHPKISYQSLTACT